MVPPVPHAGHEVGERISEGVEDLPGRGLAVGLGIGGVFELLEYEGPGKSPFGFRGPY